MASAHPVHTPAAQVFCITMNVGSKLVLHDDSGEEEVVKEQDLAAGPLGALVLWRAASLRPLNPAQTVRP